MRKGYTLALAALFALVAALFALVGYVRDHWGDMAVLNPAGSIAYEERSVMLITFALCAIVVIPVFFMLFYFAWKYRASNFKTISHHLPEWDHTRGAEVVTWIVPSVIIALLAVLAWQSSHALDPYRPLKGEPLTVEVVALDWKWLFIYPDQNIASINLLEIPVDRPVHFELTADAPMNSLWIPQLGGQIMVMPGMQTQLYLSADRTGDFNGFSGNISGDGFAGMAFTARAVSASDFEAWVASAQRSGVPLDDASYSALALPSEYNPVTLYAPVQESLYTDTMMRSMGSESAAMGGMTMPATLTNTLPGMDMGGEGAAHMQ